jgi:hypothetical protein
MFWADIRIRRALIVGSLQPIARFSFVWPERIFLLWWETPENRLQVYREHHARSLSEKSTAVNAYLTQESAAGFQRGLT